MKKLSNTSTPSVSILIRSMNRSTLTEALASVIEQTYPNCHLVIVNASGKAHKPLVDFHLPASLPAILVEPERALPRAEAANAALEVCTTDYALFLDDDDLLNKNHIEHLVNTLSRHPDSPAAYSGIRIVSDQQSRDEITEWQNGLLYAQNFLPIHSVLFRMSAVRQFECQFDTQFALLEDWDFWLQLYQLGNFVCSPVVSAIYRTHLGTSGLSADRDFALFRERRKEIYAKWFNHLPETLFVTLLDRLSTESEIQLAFRNELAHVLKQQDTTPLHLIESATDLKNECQYCQQELSDIRASLWYKAFAATRRAKHFCYQKSAIFSANPPQYKVLLNRFRTQAPAKLRSIKAQCSQWVTASPLYSKWNAKPSIAKTTQSEPDEAVDVIIPVYKGLDETQACIESVLKSKNKTCYRILVINDASPEPEVTQWLREAAQDHHFTLLENEHNLGFVKTVNKGMRTSTSADVVLLNSDTEVADHWLDRLVAAAYRGTDNTKPVGTVTPFSNNATICSYPQFCQDNKLPSGYDLHKLDQLCATTLPNEAIEIPTAVGFCMYIRRDCLNQVGFFDEEHFGLGYGEENDFCMRARALGWIHTQALDTFVWHKGSVSFGVDQQPLHVQRASKVIDHLHPHYHALIHSYVQKDPSLKPRMTLDLARIRKSTAPVVLMICHQRGGGTERHCHDLIQLHPQINWLMLTPDTNGQVILQNQIQQGAIKLRFNAISDYQDLVQILKYLNVCRIHWHHWLGVPDAMRHLAQSLAVPEDITLHDFYAICPQISLSDDNGHYCGEKGLEQCSACLQKRPSSTATNVTQWRDQKGAWLKQFERIFVPSVDSRQRLQRYYPDLDIQSISHYEATPFQEVLWKTPPTDEPLRIALIGALSLNKGAALLEQVAQQAKQQGLPLRFKLFGYACYALDGGSYLECTGPYQDEDLPSLLSEWQPHIVWFPTQAPETYSYTLSRCMTLGLPVVCTDIGAQAERISDRAYSWVLPWNTPAEQWCSWFMALKDQNSPVFDQAESNTLSAESEPEFAESFYQHDYIAPMIKDRSESCAAGETASHLPREWERHILADNQSPSLRKQAVQCLFWLKGRPWTRKVVQKIPPKLQRKVKSILLGES